MTKIDILCIVDDDPIHVFTTKKAIRYAGIADAIMVFKNGKEAYDNLIAIMESKRQLPDLILLDLNMPIWDGWDFLDEFKNVKLDKKIIIYILTSSNDPVDVRRAKEYNEVSNFLVKPVTVNTLEEELKKDNLV